MVGDTIEMIEMEGEDPNPIPSGTKGVVTKINSQVFQGIPEEHLSVKWENGRTLKVLLPHDKIKIIKRGESGTGVVGRLELTEDKIDDFVDFVSGDLELDDNFTVDITNDSDDVETLASYDINNNEVTVLGKDRALPDIIRSVAHELVHHHQNEKGQLKGLASEGADGSDIENEANAKAGEIIRVFGKQNPEIYTNNQ